MTHEDRDCRPHTTYDAPLKFLNQRQAAQLLGISIRSLERWRMTGATPRFRKFGRRVMYRLDDIMAWADAHEFASTAEADASRDSGR